MVWVYLHLNFLVRCVKRIVSARMRIGRSGLSKVIDFGRNRKRVCNFLLVRHSNLAPFQRYCGFSARDPTFIPSEFWRCLGQSQRRVSVPSVSVYLEPSEIRRKLLLSPFTNCEIDDIE